MTPYGGVLRGKRDSRGMGLQEVATELHVSASYLSGVEHGTRTPLSEGKTERLAEILSLTEADLNELEAARQESQLRFHLSAARLNPLQVRLANRFHERLATLTPAQIERIETELTFKPDVQRPNGAIARRPPR